MHGLAIFGDSGGSSNRLGLDAPLLLQSRIRACFRFGQSSDGHPSPSPPPPPPRHLKAVPLSPWLCDDAMERVSKSEALNLLTFEAQVNDCVCTLAAGVMSLQSGCVLEPAVRASHIHSSRMCIRSAIDALTPLSETLGALPLRRSAALIFEWMKSARSLAERMMEIDIAMFRDGMLKVSSALESNCPRWGSFVTDHSISDELAKLQLIQNSAIHTLPRMTRELGERMNLLKAIAEAYGMTDPLTELVYTRDPVRLASNAFAFGKRTVNVAAAVKVLFDETASLASLELVLGFRTSLPQGLLARLEMRHEDMQNGSPSGTSAGSALKRKGSSMSVKTEAHVALPSPPAKRPRGAA